MRKGIWFCLLVAMFWVMGCQQKALRGPGEGTAARQKSKETTFKAPPQSRNRDQRHCQKESRCRSLRQAAGEIPFQGGSLASRKKTKKGSATRPLPPLSSTKTEAKQTPSASEETKTMGSPQEASGEKEEVRGEVANKEKSEEKNNKREEDDKKEQEQEVTLRLITYNVLWRPIQWEKRTTRLLEVLRRTQADIIAFQEATPRFVRKLHRQKWTKDYHGIKGAGRGVPGWLYLLSRWPAKHVLFRRLPSKLGRNMLQTTLEVHGREVALANTRLESPLPFHRLRSRQLKRIFSSLQKTKAEDAILLGDFNFGDGEQPETRHLRSDYTDLWLALYPGKPGYTWNREQSLMARKWSFRREKSRRIDRILLRSNFWKPKRIRIIGNQPVVPGKRKLFPSDHFGLCGTLQAGGTLVAQGGGEE